jgi:murein L,D-transpeptidase YcbB/YkuD
MIEQSLAQPDRPAKGRYILVNLAAATVTAMQDDNVVMVSRAVIGRKDHPTPTFSSRITAVWINPSWVVPESIVIREFGGNAHTEKPGPNNPLGRLFFEMPNQYEVFLHSTNEPYLFNRDERAFSHGCVRVRDVMAMARWLMGEDRWQDEAVDVALHGLVTKRIALDRSVPIYIDYRTATVAPTGAVVYHADPYGLAAPPPDESPPPDGAVPPATAQSAAAIAVPN